jgi:hypothetical protein
LHTHRGIKRQGKAWSSLAGKLSKEPAFAECKGVDGPACLKKWDELVKAAREEAVRPPERQSGRAEPESELQATIMRCLLSADEIEDARQRVLAGKAEQEKEKEAAEDLALQAADVGAKALSGKKRKPSARDSLNDEQEFLQALLTESPEMIELERQRLRIEEERLRLQDKQQTELFELLKLALTSGIKQKRTTKLRRA